MSPGATETCNWIDDNCRNGIDEAGASGCTTYYRDGDNDGWGSTSSQCLCTPADPFDVTNDDDCNDSDASVWPGAAEQCNQRDDNCNGSADEGFECRLGQSEQQSCGQKCGKQARSCTGSCSWGAWGSCGGEGVCSPGEQQTESCGYCGTRTRTCTSSCAWGLWSSCNGQGVCSYGASESRSCGNCGTQSRSCNSSCQWNSWGTCTGQGACSSGSTRNCLDACGKQTCSSSCQWGSCSYTRDGYESNDTWGTATYMGAYTEPNAPGARSAWLHTDSDVDRFWWRGTESSSLTDLSLAASVTLVSSSSLWHELCIYWDDGYNGSIDKQACKTGWGTITATVDGLDSWGSTQVGDIDVSVSGDWSCSSYTLQFTWN
ncbi:MAG: putative metal-binding motif-containing protein [Deltaproteobacteria bacterium]|nr:putative metal-binding motif-containing protein [Deltaproteobacteria bacterium]